VMAINYKSDDFSEVLSEQLGAQGIDVILDMIGGEYVQKNMAIAARNGRIAMIAFQGGHKVDTSLLPMLMKSLTLSASTLRPQTQKEKSLIATQLKTTIWPHLETGKIVPVIAAEFPLEKAASAHKLMESSTHIGKIVLTI